MLFRNLFEPKVWKYGVAPIPLIPSDSKPPNQKSLDRIIHASIFDSNHTLHYDIQIPFLSKPLNIPLQKLPQLPI